MDRFIEKGFLEFIAGLALDGIVLIDEYFAWSGRRRLVAATFWLSNSGFT